MEEEFWEKKDICSIIYELFMAARHKIIRCKSPFILLLVRKEGEKTKY